MVSQSMLIAQLEIEPKTSDSLEVYPSPVPYCRSLTLTSTRVSNNSIIFQHYREIASDCTVLRVQDQKPALISGASHEFCVPKLPYTCLTWLQIQGFS